MRVIFIGCVNFSKTMLECVLEIDCIEVVGIITKRNSKFNTDFNSLLPLAEKNNIPCFLYEGKSSDDSLYSWSKEKNPDVIYCFGWSYLLKENLISVPKIGVIGYHPTLLPKNKGRHPVIWALVLGLDCIASTFFFIDPGVDSGDLLDQIPINIDSYDDASTLYKKLTETALEQVKKFSRDLDSGTYVRVKQDMSQATSWRKRTKADGCIDWRMGSLSICNLVRALTHPYVGAHCVYKGQDIKIWRIKKMYYGLSDIEPGKIIDLNRNKNETYIKSGDGVMGIYDHGFDILPEIGEYL